MELAAGLFRSTLPVMVIRRLRSFLRIGVLGMAAALVGCGPAPEQEEDAGGDSQAELLLRYLEEPERDPSAGFEFVGAESCRSCHEDAYTDWESSHHHAAMLPATEETVVGDFDDVEFEHFGHRSRFFRRDGEFWVNTEDGEGERRDFKIEYTFGIEPLQQYLIAFPGGRLQALQICWDTRPESEGGQRWFHLYPDEAIPPEDELHWTKRHFNWNYMCADCHSTNLAKGYDPASNEYHTTWSEMNVSCEACHGPGSKHVAWAEAYAGGQEVGGEKGSMGLLTQLKEPEEGYWELHPETGKPVRSRPLHSQVQLETCAPCHAHRQPLQEKKFHGQGFLDSYSHSVLDRVHYHADGQIKEEVYVYGSFVQSKMYHSQVRCTDCHHPHTMRVYAHDNTLCTRCHQPQKYDTPAHHFHPPATTGASCVECHMPAKYYMVVDKRRDHSIRVPRPDLSAKYGTPNACTMCHEDQSDEWAAEAFENWWGKRQRPSFGETLAKGRRDPRIWEDELGRLARRETEPGIARATALQLLAEEATAGGLDVIRGRLEDGDPIVRREAVAALEAYPPAQRLEGAVARLHDPVRAVRAEAARILAPAPRGAFSEEEQEAFDFALEEYVDSQRAVMDVPEGRMNLALLRQNLGDPAGAERYYRSAMELDPGHIPARVNLAELLYAGGRLDEAGPVLEAGVEAAPGNGFAWEALGRHLIRQRRYEEGLEKLERAVELQPGRAELHYFLGVGLNSVGRYEDALPFLEKALELAPESVEYASGATAIARDAGDFATALRFVNRLEAMQPGNPQFGALRAELERALQQR